MNFIVDVDDREKCTKLISCLDLTFIEFDKELLVLRLIDEARNRRKILVLMASDGIVVGSCFHPLNL